MRSWGLGRNSKAQRLRFSLVIFVAQRSPRPPPPASSSPTRSIPSGCTDGGGKWEREWVRDLGFISNPTPPAPTPLTDWGLPSAERERMPELGRDGRLLLFTKSLQQSHLPGFLSRCLVGPSFPPHGSRSQPQNGALHPSLSQTGAEEAAGGLVMALPHWYEPTGLNFPLFF